MKKLQTKEIDTLFDAILLLENREECYKFFEDICTIRELTDIAQRLKAAKMLKNGENYSVVSSETGMSTATISRVSKCLEYGEGGYELVLERLEKIETLFNLDRYSSNSYKKLVDEANIIRIMYATYCLRKKDELLPQIKNKLLTISLLFQNKLLKVKPIQNESTKNLKQNIIYTGAY